jgi:glycolate oxidase iron-sulfur subunit
MQTHFSITQLQDPRTAEVNSILRACVHCGFCTATCPTYVLGGDERDSPRGRIYMIKAMLEQGEPASTETVTHIDRCLSCLACMTTCPSGVHYMHLIDEARIHVEKTYQRPWPTRLLRWLLATTMVRPGLFRLSLVAARIGKPLAVLLPALGLTRLRQILALAPGRPPSSAASGPGTYPAEGPRRGRLALLMGCVQSVIDPGINAATIRLLNRLGFDVVVAGDEPCCGSLPHHMGREEDALARARRSIDQWTSAKVDAVIITASGCGTTIKDYGHMLRHDQAYAAKAAAISAKAKDVVEFLLPLNLPPASARLRVTYHSACSMQHGQKLTSQAQSLLRQAGFSVADVPEGHLCCGSAGTYNIMQPAIATALRDRKLANIATTTPEVIATGNIGCITQLASGTETPVVHTVQLLDWAYGGPCPAGLEALTGRS